MSARLHQLAGLERYITQPRLRAYLYDGNGKVLPAGSILRNPAYARTLRAISRGGSRAFYEGDIARDIVESVTLHAGTRATSRCAILRLTTSSCASPCAALTACTACAGFRCPRQGASPCCRC
jgi:gamma-glutamyltranspeptidase/glutathione hydrolase